MKTIILFLVNICITTIVISQKIFQGEITYRLHASFEKDDDLELKVLFAPNKLLLSFKEKNGVHYERPAIILLDSGKIYTLNNESKNYSVKKLIVRQKKILTTEKKEILGISTRPVQLERLSNLPDLFRFANTTLYIADSLYFPIPEIYEGNQELLIINKNKIVLGALAKMDINILPLYDSYKEEDSTNNQPKEIVVEAIDIKPIIIDESKFIIPDDYVNSAAIKYNNYEDGEKIRALPDSIETEMTKPEKNKPVKPKTPKKPVKNSSTIRRKN